MQADIGLHDIADRLLYTDDPDLHLSRPFFCRSSADC
jgi:hypothetical protein